MSYKTRLAFNEIITQSPAVQLLQDKISAFIKANQLVRMSLDEHTAAHCQVANIRDGILILATRSPALRHQIRFRGPEVLSALRAHQEWCHLKSIHTITQPDDLESNRLNGAILPGPRALSPESIACLHATASSVSSRALQKALMHLSQHVSLDSSSVD